MIEKMYLKVVENTNRTILAIVVLLIIGYVFKDLAISCDHAYTIKHNHDREAYVYSVISLASFLIMGMILTCIIVDGICNLKFPASVQIQNDNVEYVVEFFQSEEVQALKKTANDEKIDKSYAQEFDEILSNLGVNLEKNEYMENGP